MIELKVPDMSCGHCAASIRQAVQALDPAAAITVDLEQHRVRIEPAAADAAALTAAIREAGYSPEPA